MLPVPGYWSLQAFWQEWASSHGTGNVTKKKEDWLHAGFKSAIQWKYIYIYKKNCFFWILHTLYPLDSTTISIIYPLCPDNRHIYEDSLESIKWRKLTQMSLKRSNRNIAVIYSNVVYCMNKDKRMICIHYRSVKPLPVEHGGIFTYTYLCSQP